ncbi:MAG TPA: hypothetical protein VKE95_06245 [Burkholderiales bacterium]|nr:hypothetical protein [Burkholderiales bacterium]
MSLKTMGFRDISALRAAWLTALVVFVFFSVVINIQAHGWVSWYRLSVSGEKVQAIVTRRQAANHQTCYFEYTINSVHYEGADQGCHLEIGHRLMATYLPEDPTFATSSSPVQQLMFLTLGPLGLSVVGGALMALRLSRRRRHSSSDSVEGS